MSSGLPTASPGSAVTAMPAPPGSGGDDFAAVRPHGKEKKKEKKKDKKKKKKRRVVHIGNYTLVGALGAGSTGTVHLARHKEKGAVAIKTIHKRTLNEEAFDRVIREIQILQRLDHPNVVKLHDVLESKESLHIVMEYCAGGEVFDAVERMNMTETLARQIVRQAVEGLSHCHDHGIIHRDVKLENLLLGSDYQTLKITDFGLSAMVAESDVRAQLSTICGTPNYAAPELLSLETASYEGPPVDVWSLGVCLYVMVAGRFPYDGPTIPDIYNKILNVTYTIPAAVSETASDLLRAIFVRDPTTRVTLDQIALHAWTLGYDNFADVPEVLGADVVLAPPSAGGPSDTNDDEAAVATTPTAPLIDVSVAADTPSSIATGNSNAGGSKKSKKKKRPPQIFTRESQDLPLNTAETQAAARARKRKALRTPITMQESLGDVFSLSTPNERVPVSRAPAGTGGAAPSAQNTPGAAAPAHSGTFIGPNATIGGDNGANAGHGEGSSGNDDTGEEPTTDSVLEGDDSSDCSWSSSWDVSSSSDGGGHHHHHHHHGRHHSGRGGEGESGSDGPAGSPVATVPDDTVGDYTSLPMPPPT